MARKHLISLAALALITAATGCVSQEKYNALKLDRDRYAEQLGQAQNEASSARSEAEASANSYEARSRSFKYSCLLPTTGGGSVTWVIRSPGSNTVSRCGVLPGRE